MSDQEQFPSAFQAMVDHLKRNGYAVEIVRKLLTFAQVEVTSPQGETTSIDLGIDWRADPPAQLAIGPVLSQDDAVGNKIATLFSRGEVRDFLDADSIRQSGEYTDAELYRLAKRSDAGFSLDFLSQRLKFVTQIEHREVADYGISADQLDGIKQRLSSWSSEIRDSLPQAQEPQMIGDPALLQPLDDYSLDSDHGIGL